MPGNCGVAVLIEFKSTALIQHVGGRCFAQASLELIMPWLGHAEWLLHCRPMFSRWIISRPSPIKAPHSPEPVIHVCFSSFLLVCDNKGGIFPPQRYYYRESQVSGHQIISVKAIFCKQNISIERKREVYNGADFKLRADRGHLKVGPACLWRLGMFISCYKLNGITWGPCFIQRPAPVQRGCSEGPPQIRVSQLCISGF